MLARQKSLVSSLNASLVCALLALAAVPVAEAGRTFTEGVMPAPRAVPAHPAAKAAPDAAGFYEVDLLVLYAPSFPEFYGGAEAAPGAIAQLLESVNQIYAESQVPIRFLLVATQEYVPPQGLNNLSGEYWDDPKVRALRDEVGADFVMLLYGGPPGPENSCTGLAQGTFNSGAAYDAAYTDDSVEPQYVNPETAYAQARVNNEPCEAIVFAHELGHLAGAGHGHQQPGTGGWKHYARAWQCGNPAFISVMNESEELGTHGRFFSNPEMSREGEACGTQVSDNARAMRLAAPYLAAYRDRPAPAEARRQPRRFGGASALWMLTALMAAFAVRRSGLMHRR